MLRTDCGSLRAIRPESDATLELRSLVELRAGRVHERTALFHRLRARLDEWCPDLSHLCDDFNRIWQRRLHERSRLQRDLHQAHGRPIHAFVKQHRLGHATAECIHAARKATPMPIPETIMTSLRLDIEHLLAQIEVLTGAITEVDDRIQQKLDEHPDAQVFRPPPVKGANSIATILAGLGGDREDNPGHRQLAAAWGMAR